MAPFYQTPSRGTSLRPLCEEMHNSVAYPLHYPERAHLKICTTHPPLFSRARSYIEQPVGVGFSFSSVPSDYQNLDDHVAAHDNAAFLSAFFEKYPAYRSLPLWLTSESYGGNYIPQATRVVLEGTDTRLANQLAGFIVGNPVFSIDENANFATIMNAVTAGILMGHSLIPAAFYDAYVKAGCAVLNPPADPCNKLTTEMFALAGPCFETNACSDNLYCA